MDGLVSIPIEQVWASSSTGASSHSMPGYSGRTRPSHTAAFHQLHPQPHRMPSPGAARQQSSYHSNSSAGGNSTGSSRGVSAFQQAAAQSSNSSSNSSRQYSFEPLNSGAARDYRDQYHLPAAGAMAPVSVPSRRHSTEGRHAVSMPPAPSAASLPASLSSRTASGGSASNAASSSSHGLRRLHRHSGSGSFLSAAANQLLSSLGMLSSLSLLSSSDGGGRSSSGGSSRGSPVRGRTRASSSTSGRSALRSALLVRSPALLLDPEGSESYDDLLALDQFNVKRVVRPSVMAALPCRMPCEADRQQDAQCFICFEQWGPPGPPPDNQADSQAREGRSSRAIAPGKAAAEVCGCSCCSNHNHGLLAGTAMTAGTAGAAPRYHRDDGWLDDELTQEWLDCWDDWAVGPEAAADNHSDAARTSSCCSCSGRCGKGAAAGLCGSARQDLESMVLIQQLPCGHEYCAGCIGRWLAQHATCPICRWTFPEAQTHLIDVHK